MDWRSIRELLRAEPFRPFRIVMVNGEKFDISHPKAAFLTLNAILVGVDIGDDGIPEEFRSFSYSEVKEIKQSNKEKRRR